jgi:hypothetical protein
MKPRLGLVALVPSLAVRTLDGSRGRPNEAAQSGMVCTRLSIVREVFRGAHIACARRVQVVGGRG